MPETFSVLAQLDLAISNAVPIYTVPALTQAVMKHIKIVNHDTAAHTVEMWQGGTATSNIILPELTLQGGEWAEFDGAMVGEAASAIHASSDAASAISLTMYGLEIT